MLFILKLKLRQFGRKVKQFFVKKRFVQSYQTKKRILVVFLFIFNAYILFDVSVKMPQVEISIQGHGFVVENKALAKSEALETIVAIESDPQKAILQKVGEKTGVDWKVLYGIFMKETQLDCDRMGDYQMSKPSIGCFQISLHYHPEVKMSQATDLEWSATWTAERMKKTLESTGSMDLAIALHNGNPSNPSVQQYVKDVKKNMENL